MASSTDINPLAEGNTKFTNALYNLLRETPGNIFFSPISIEAVLALAHAGAAGNTAVEIQKSACLPESREASSKAFGQLIDTLTSNTNVTLSLANALYADKQFQIKEDYLSLVQKGFKSELGQVDFAQSAEARRTINNWVADKTNNKITELFDSGSLDSATQLVLLNAIYFKGNWLHKFPAAATKKGTFHLNEKDTKEVDFMTIKEKFVVNENDDFFIVQVPYKGEEVSMVLIVPKNITGLSAVEQTLPDLDINQLLEDGRKREVILTMPKFKLEKTIELNEVLQKLGINDMFDERRADLTGISNVPLFVSKAIQKSFIEVNEEGSEAAAVTAALIRKKRSLDVSFPLEITVDRPFMFFLLFKHVRLFAGSMCDPGDEFLGPSQIQHTEL